MTDTLHYLVLQAKLTVTAGHFGIFPEPELLVWLRAVQPIEPIDSAGERPRSFRADELSVTPECISRLISIINTIGFPEHLLEIENTGDPETVWWASATPEVTINDVSGRLRFGFGRDGIHGRDASGVKEVLRALFECAGVRSYWSGVLAAGARSQT